jgi:hypothetical protein
VTRRSPIVVAAVVVAVASMARVVERPDRWLAGDPTVDAYGTWWFHWVVADALSRFELPIRSNLLFFPWGKEVLLHTGGNLLDAVAVAPVRLAFGGVWAFNLVVFVAIAGNAAAAGLAAARRGGLVTGVAAAVVVGVHPWPLFELAQGRPTQALLAPLILALDLGDRALHDASSTRRTAAWAGVALAVAAATYWFAALFGALALGVLALAPPSRERLVRLGVTGVTTAVLVAPALALLAPALAAGRMGGLLPIEPWLHGTPNWETVDGDTVRMSTLHLTGSIAFDTGKGRVDAVHVLGPVALALALLGPARWKAVSVLGLLLALGPIVFGLPNPLYLALALALPMVRRLYWPSRALALWVVAAFPSLAARSRAGAVILAGAAVLESVAVGALPLPVWDAKVEPALGCLAAEEGAAIVLPWAADQHTLVEQTVHRRPTFNGMADRVSALVPAEALDLRTRNGWLRALLIADRNPKDGTAWTAEERAEVGALGYRWVVLRTERVPENRRRSVLRRLPELLGAPVHQDDDVVIYAPWGGTLDCG